MPVTVQTMLWTTETKTKPVQNNIIAVSRVLAKSGYSITDASHRAPLRSSVCEGSVGLGSESILLCISSAVHT